MAINIDTPNIAKYEHVVAVRRSDRMRLAATRHLVKTSELLQQAAERGFVDWYHLPVAYIEAWPWNALGVDSEEFLIPKYSPLDPTEYLVD